MKITQAAVNHTITTIMIFIALFALGVVSLSRLGLELFPDVSFPTVIVATVYPGVGPYEIESSLTKPLEDALSSLSGVKYVRSTSIEGASLVALGFDWDTDLDMVVADIREKLNTIEDDLPEGIQRPNIYKLNPEELPSLTFNLSTRTSGIDIRKLAEEKVIPRLEKIKGVARASVYGGREGAVMCRLDLDALSKLEIPITQVLNAFQGENINLPAGSISLNDRSVILRTVGEFASVDDIGLVLVGYRNQVPIFLHDIADVRLDFLPQEEFVRAGGETGVMISIRKQPGHNTVQINREVKEKLSSLEKELPPSVRIQIQSDQSQSIIRSIGGVANAAWQGGILAVFVLLFFLRNIRSTLIISLVIPVSLIVTFSLMDFGGISINIISLMGITLGVGMFVDNSIVVLESIFRKQLSGIPRKDAAIQGTSEVGRAIIASTLTTVAVFVPMIFVKGIAGLMFDDLAGTISFALLISLVAALTLVPVLCSQFMKIERGTRVSAPSLSEDSTYELSLADLEVVTGNRHLDSAGKKIQVWLYQLDDGYEKLITWALDHVKIILLVALILFALSIGSIFLLGMEFLPEADEGEFAVSIETKLGSTFEYTEGKVIEMENLILQNLGDVVLSMSSRIGEGGEYVDAGDEGSHLAVIFTKIVEKDKRKRSIWQVINDLEQLFQNNVFDVKYHLRVEGISNLAASASGDSSPVVIELSGDNLDSLEEYSRKIQDALGRVTGIRSIRTSHKTGKPELQFVVKRREALSLGLTPLEIAATLRTAFKGTEVTRYSTDEEDYKVVIVLREEDRNQLDRLGTLFFINPAGTRIPLENLVDVKEGKGPLSIRRMRRTRIIKVTASLTGELPLSRVMEDLRGEIGRMGNPPIGITMEFAGAGNDMAESFKSLFLALIFAVGLVYMVMASQFESLLHPFVVMLSVPFAAIGLVASHLLTGTTFSMMSFVGAILLVGIVVNNAIVLIDYINLLRSRGIPLKDAIIKGGKTRLKPILMTTLTTVFAMLPMSLGIGTGAELRAPMGRAIVGGLTTSTLVTLVLIPTLYWVVENRLKKTLAESPLEQEASY